MLSNSLNKTEMKKLKLIQPYSQFESDVKRIVKIFSNRGYEISATDAENAWQRYSDSMCAGWMNLDDEDEFVFFTSFRYFEELN